MFGLYLNLGELVDFLLGIGTLDIADDDGVPKGERFGLDFRTEFEPPR